MRLIPLLLGSLAVAGLALMIAMAVAAQTTADIDLAKVRARANIYAEDAAAFAETVSKRSDALREDAVVARDEARANRHHYADRLAAPAHGADDETLDPVFNFDRLIADASAAEKASFGEAPRFVAFVSTSMPSASLKRIMTDVPRAGGVVVLRGFPGNSARRLVAALLKSVDAEHAMDGVGIDPRLFRAFAVDAVPAYVMASSDFDLCDGFDCETAVPPHDRMVGNVTTEYALTTFAAGSGAGAEMARMHLARLREAVQ